MKENQNGHTTRFVLLLGAFFLMFFASAIVHLLEGESKFVRVIMTIGFISTLASAAYAVSAKRRTLVVLRGLAGVTVLLSLVNTFAENDFLRVTSLMVSVAFLVLVVLPIMRMVLTADRVTTDTLAASICVYLLLGMIWALIYSLVEHAAPGSFRMPAGEEMAFGGGESINVLYYSYVTLTTLGYGDIAPIGEAARILAITEAMIGQIFLVVLVARLVSLNVAQAMRQDPNG